MNLMLFMTEDKLREIIAEEVLLAIMCHEGTIHRTKEMEINKLQPFLVIPKRRIQNNG